MGLTFFCSARELSETRVQPSHDRLIFENFSSFSLPLFLCLENLGLRST
jgi:hypothetical protein